MRPAVLSSAIVLVAIFALAPAGQTQTATQTPTDDVKISTKAATAPEPPEPPIQSGVYGFSGAKAPDSAASGVVGECMWIYDAQNQNQIATAHCYQNNPGTFRLVLKPGRYVVHGPGGVKPIEVKDGGWVKIISIADLPVAP
jgi:hypothetical protein